MIHQLFIHYSCIIHPRAACGGRFIILNIMHVLCTWSFRYIEHYFYAQRHDKNLINFRDGQAVNRSANMVVKFLKQIEGKIGRRF
jgi:hypothetical protein